MNNIFKLFYCSLFVFTIIVSPLKANEHTDKTRSFLNESLKLLEKDNLTEARKHQIIVDRYIPYVNFGWNAKMAMGRPYQQLSKQEQQEYIDEYTKYISYLWLPKLNYDRRLGIKIAVLDKSQKLNDTDENVTIQLEALDGAKYDLILRTRLTKDAKQFQILNLNMEGIDLASMYRTQFQSIMEQNKGDPKSVITYLKKQNAEYKKKADFNIDLNKYKK